MVLNVGRMNDDFVGPITSAPQLPDGGDCWFNNHPPARSLGSTDHFDPRQALRLQESPGFWIYAAIRSILANAGRAFASLCFTLRTKSSEMGNNPR